MQGTAAHRQESTFCATPSQTRFSDKALTKDGALHLLRRGPEQRQAQHASTLADDHVHVEGETFDNTSAGDLARLLAGLGVSGQIGLENALVGLTYANG